MDSQDLLTPILVTGYGRSGSPAVVPALGTDPRVASARASPFENRSLNYLTKFALVPGRRASSVLNETQLYDSADARLGPPSWPPAGSSLMPAPAEWL